MSEDELKDFISSRVEMLEELGGAEASGTDPYLAGAWAEVKAITAVMDL